MVQSRPSTQQLTFPKSVNTAHCLTKPIPLLSLSQQRRLVSPTVQQPFKQIPASPLAYTRNRKIPSPSKDMIENIDASVKRVKSAVINRMSQNNFKRNESNQYFGWLLKARLQPLTITRKCRGPTVQECRGIVGCCKSATSKTWSYHDRVHGKTRTPRPKSDHITTRGSVVTTSQSKKKGSPKGAQNKVHNIQHIINKPYRKEAVMNTGAPAPIKMITVGRSSNVNAVLETKYKCFSGQFCGQYNVPGSTIKSQPHNNVFVPMYGMFNAEECYVYEHDAAVQNSRKPVVLPPKSSGKSSFNLELDFMLDKFDSDTEEPASYGKSDIQRIASKYCSSGGSGRISGMLDWEDVVSNIADGALDMSGSRRKKKEKKSTKLRSPIMFTDKKKDVRSKGCGIKPAQLDHTQQQSSAESEDVTWYDVNSLRLRNG